MIGNAERKNNHEERSCEAKALLDIDTLPSPGTPRRAVGSFLEDIAQVQLELFEGDTRTRVGSLMLAQMRYYPASRA
jgi:hypothetical protein